MASSPSYGKSIESTRSADRREAEASTECSCGQDCECGHASDQAPVEAADTSAAKAMSELLQLLALTGKIANHDAVLDPAKLFRVEDVAPTVSYSATQLCSRLSRFLL